MAAVEQEDVSDHTTRMRRELDYCISLHSNGACHRSRMHSFQQSVREVNHPSIRDVRKASLDWFRKVHLPSRTISLHHVDQISCFEFRRKFQQGNLPCLLRGLDRREFESLSTKWVSQDGTINKEWFLNTFGGDALVPVRKQSAGAMDEDGRIDECETVEFSMTEWANCVPESHLYLKDWHLIKQMHDRGIFDTLYEVPDYFKRDILNEFLDRVTGGDYKFVYWGPAGSQTPVHSDVLNSFSWSYNVVGTKEWTIYPPDENISIVVQQEAGECMFVPSGWRHEVKNLVETLSINHNWATSANVDKLVDSVIADMVAVERECAQWSIPLDAFEALEAMLRGCSGLDVACCFYLLVSSILNLMYQNASEDCDDDAVLIAEALRTLLIHGEQMHIQARMSVALGSEPLALQALDIARDVLSKFE